MSIQATQVIAGPLAARRRRRPVGSGTLQLHRAAAAPKPLPERMPPIPPPSDVGGDWPIDYAAARKFAQMTLDQIDWSKPDLVLWVSGTANPEKGEFPQISAAFINAVQRAYQQGGASINLMRYESSWNMRTSLATGVETLRMVLHGIAARGGGQRVLLAGESQGAWVAGEALKDPASKAAVTRTALWGHPSIAATHFHDGSDPTVAEVNHRYDRVSYPISGDRALAMDAMIALQTNLNGSTLPIIARAFVQNPLPGLLSLFSLLRDRMPPQIQAWMPEPHDYSRDFLTGVEFLRDGVKSAAARGAELLRH